MLELLAVLVFIMTRLMCILLPKVVCSFGQFCKVLRKPQKLLHSYFIVNCLKFFTISLINFDVKS